MRLHWFLVCLENAVAAGIGSICDFSERLLDHLIGGHKQGLRSVAIWRLGGL